MATSLDKEDSQCYIRLSGFMYVTNAFKGGWHLSRMSDKDSIFVCMLSSVKGLFQFMGKLLNNVNSSLTKDEFSFHFIHLTRKIGKNFKFELRQIIST